jgi:hypothetical protein
MTWFWRAATPFGDIPDYIQAFEHLDHCPVCVSGLALTLSLDQVTH